MARSPRSIYIFIGPPGSGKGSVSSLCIERYGWVQLSTGNLCRMHIANQTELGKQIDFLIKSGKLVADSYIDSMVAQWLDEVLALDVSAFVLDGYPRTIAQAESFEYLVQKKQEQEPLSVEIVRFSATDECVLERILGRIVCQNKECQSVYSSGPLGIVPKAVAVCDKCESPLGSRSDDNKNTAIERLRAYREHEDKLLSFYHSRGYQVSECYVDKPLEAVFEDFTTLVDVKVNG